MLVSTWLVLSVAGVAQMTTTTVSDTVYSADGSPAQGSVLISWPQFTTLNGASVAAGSTTVTLSSGGGLSVTLAPNAGSNPIGSYYTVLYHLNDGTLTRENWVVPVSSAPVNLAVVRSTVLPLSVAMQTVSKAYVDRAVASIPVGATSSTLGTVKLAAGQTSTTLAAVATTGSASDLSAGTLADARLSSNVPLLNATTNTFTGAQVASSFNTTGGVGGIFSTSGNYQGQQSIFGGRMQYLGYFGIELRGNQRDPIAAVSGANTDASVTVYGVIGNNEDIMDWTNNAGTKLASVDASGNISTTGNMATGQYTPANSSATCTTGQFWTDTSYLYVCTATNTIKRAALSSF
ncbi:MAG TPA: hypothetical protein VNU94_01430 [Acidobacteriaceae bacterium]|nr:hypothetical protein [Acidobacteriaceae bacterium]